MTRAGIDFYFYESEIHADRAARSMHEGINSTIILRRLLVQGHRSCKKWKHPLLFQTFCIMERM